MGQGYVLKCKNCDYKYTAMTSIGMLFPVEYRDTMKDIRDGRLGEEYRAFVEENPDAVVNLDRKVGICDKCGRIDTLMELSLYKPLKPSSEYREEEYVMPLELEECYIKCKDYEHKCSCGGNIRLISLEDEGDIGLLKCPICGSALEIGQDRILWD